MTANASGIAPAVSIKGAVAANVQAMPASLIETGVQAGFNALIDSEKPVQP